MIPAMDESARQLDINGFIGIANNPISREGIFPYSGGQIGAPEPGRIYKVYRPASELSTPETLASFRTVPFIDGHTMLGRGQEPAEDVGVQGTTGDDIRFEDGVMTANLKIFSSKLAEKIKSGKTELSCGYRCVYDFTPGVWNGQPYDAVQRQIRGNHLALVDEGRMGPSVAVLDQMTFTVDAKEQGQTMDEELKKLLDAIVARLDGFDAALAKLLAAEAAEATGGEDKPPPAADEDPAKATAGGEDKPPPAADEDPAKAVPVAGAAKDEETKAMDALTKSVKALSAKVSAITPAMDEAAIVQMVAKKNKLASDLSRHIGVFDHSAMTHADVVAYGLKQLGLKNVPAGSEAVALDAALGVMKVAQPFTLAADAAQTSLAKQVSGYIEGAK